MSQTMPATIPGVTHHSTLLNGDPLHHVSAGSQGSPVLLVHGFPETWWAFNRVIPLLAPEHRVIAVDLPGFGESGRSAGEYSSSFAAESLRQLIERLGLGPVHLVAQDIAGAATFRLAAGHPEAVRSYSAIEMGLAGFGLEALADVTRGGAWHIGLLAAPGIPELLLAGRERSFLVDHALPAMTSNPEAVTAEDADELARAYATPGGYAGAAGLYRSMLTEGEEIRHIADERRLQVPVLAIGAGTGPFTARTMHAVADDVTEVDLDGVGHLAALEAPGAVADALLGFYRAVEAG